MILPENLREKLNNLLAKIGGKNLKMAREELTAKYKTHFGQGQSFINSENDGLTYALCRMPATFGVLYSLISNLIFQEKLKNVNSISDIGSGTGAGYFAFKELFDEVDIKLYEKEKFMRDVFAELCENKIHALPLDIVCGKPEEKSDLVLCSYVLSEINDSARKTAFLNLLESSNKYVLIVDTGTPKVYEEYLKLKPVAEKAGYRLTAPCMCNTCPLQNDYCQFYARVERSSALKNAKGATQSFEDEKYFYLLFEKIDNETVQNIFDCKSRVIRRPVYKPNMVELVLCTTDGVKKQVFTKKNKELYKRAKKAKINDIILNANN